MGAYSGLILEGIEEIETLPYNILEVLICLSMKLTSQQIYGNQNSPLKFETGVSSVSIYESIFKSVCFGEDDGALLNFQKFAFSVYITSSIFDSNIAYSPRGFIYAQKSFVSFTMVQTSFVSNIGILNVLDLEIENSDKAPIESCVFFGNNAVDKDMSPSIFSSSQYYNFLTLNEINFSKNGHGQNSKVVSGFFFTKTIFKFSSFIDNRLTYLFFCQSMGLENSILMGNDVDLFLQNNDNYTAYFSESFFSQNITFIEGGNLSFKGCLAQHVLLKIGCGFVEERFEGINNENVNKIPHKITIYGEKYQFAGFKWKIEYTIWIILGSLAIIFTIAVILVRLFIMKKERDRFQARFTLQESVFENFG